MLRLAKILADHRVCSRRAAEKMIVQGKVKVNEKLVSSPNGAYFVSESDKIFVPNFGNISIENKSAKNLKETKLFLANKLLGEIVSYDDPTNHPTLFQRLATMKLPQNLISIGRLDLNTSGLLLLTNNGNFAQYLMRPNTSLYRTYRATVTTKYEVTEDLLTSMNRGKVSFNNVQFGKIRTTLLSKGSQNAVLQVSTNDGKYREIRRFLELFGFRVKKLHRTQFGPFKVDKLHKGDVVEVSIPAELKEKYERSLEVEITNNST